MVTRTDVKQERVKQEVVRKCWREIEQRKDGTPIPAEVAREDAHRASVPAIEMVGRAASGSSVFLGGRPHEENHELAFIHNRAAANLGLKVSSPGELLAYYQELKARGLKIGPVYNHRFALSLFVHDPEGNLIEIYWPTGRRDIAPPHFEPLDLENQTEDGLRKLVGSPS